MAERRNSMGKMAVTSDNHEVKENMSKEDIEQRHITNNIRPGINVVPTKKKTFKITSVKLNDTNDGDSMDDLDESHTEMTEDYSSEILDTSHATDYEQETPSAAEDMPLTNRQVGDGKEKTETEMHSRFRVVKIETKEPFHRGRWICLDFLDPQPAVNPEKSDIKVYDEANSGSSSAGSSIHYIHGVDDPAKNPLIAGATGTVYNATSQPTESQSTSNQVDTFQPIHPAPNTAQSNMSSNPQSQISLGYYPDSSQGQGTNQLLGQTLNQSHSHQSINTVASVDSVQNVSGQPMIGDVLSGQATSHTQSETSSIQQPNVYPHFSSGHAPQIPGTPMAYQPHNQATSQNTSVAGQPTSAQNQDQTSSTYQTFVNLGQQTANPGIANEKDESIPSEVATALNLTLDVPNSTSDTVNHMDAMQSESGTCSRAENHLTGELDRDLNVIQNQNALPALAAAVEDLQSPQEEDQGGNFKDFINQCLLEESDQSIQQCVVDYVEREHMTAERPTKASVCNKSAKTVAARKTVAAPPKTVATINMAKAMPFALNFNKDREKQEESNKENSCSETWSTDEDDVIIDERNSGDDTGASGDSGAKEDISGAKEDISGEDISGAKEDISGACLCKNCPYKLLVEKQQETVRFPEFEQGGKAGLYDVEEAKKNKMLMELVPGTGVCVPVKTYEIVFTLSVTRTEIASKLFRTFFSPEEIRNAGRIKYLRNGSKIVDAIITCAMRVKTSLPQVDYGKMKKALLNVMTYELRNKEEMKQKSQKRKRKDMTAAKEPEKERHDS